MLPVRSRATVADSLPRLSDLVAARGMNVFAVIDHSGEARRVGLELRETRVVIFGSPTPGTPVTVASPLVALPLPLKALASTDAGQPPCSSTDPLPFPAPPQ